MQSWKEVNEDGVEVEVVKAEEAERLLESVTIRLAGVEDERDALAAHVDRLEDIIERSTLADSPAAESALEDTPETSLDRLKAQMLIEELEQLQTIFDPPEPVESLEEAYRMIEQRIIGLRTLL